MAITPVQGKQIATASWANNAVSSSYALTASYALNAGGTTINTGSFVTTSSFNSFTSSYNTGSFTGSFTGSLFGTASWAVSSSRAITSSFAISSSYALSSSFAISSSRAVTSSFAISASQAQNAISSSYAVTSSYAVSSSQAQNAVSASNATTASYATTAAAASTISAAITNNVDNYVLTATGTGVINGESRLTFDGNTLAEVGKFQQGDITNLADGAYSHAEGIGTVTLLDYSHAEGTGSFTGQYGYLANTMRDAYTLQIDRDVASHFSGGYIIYDDTKYANIYGVVVLPYSSVSYSSTTDIVLNQDVSSGFTGALIGIPGVSTPVDYTHILPSYTTAPHAEGLGTIADGNASHAEGKSSTSVGDYSHAEGSGSLTVAQYSHAEGRATKTFGSGSHAEGINTITVNPHSHTEGSQTYTGQYAYECTVNDKTEIYTNARYGDVSSQFTSAYIVFDDTTTGNINGLIEVKVASVTWTGTQVKIVSETNIAQSSKGYVGVGGLFAPTKADTFIPLSKKSSHAEGDSTFALGEGSHAEGYGTRTTGDYSSARGIGTIAQGHYQTIIGKYNIPSSDTGYTLIVGNGTSDSARSNALTIRNSAVAIPGTLNVTNGITGNLSGTASWASNVVSASYAATASLLLGSVVSASYATTASYALNGGSGATLPYSGSAVITGSLTVSSSLTVTGSLRVSGSITGSLFGTSSWAQNATTAPLYLPLAGGTLSGNVTAAGRSFTFQDLVLGSGTTVGTIKTDGAKPIGIYPNFNFETTRFYANGNVGFQNGGTYTDTGYRLQISASSAVSGALQVIGTTVITGSLSISQGVTGSLFGTSSWAVSSSNSTTASYVLQAVSSSYALSSSFAATSSYSTNFTISGSINNVDYIDFNPTKYDTVTPGIIPTQKEGRLFYDTGSQTLCMYNAETDVTLNIGQESWLRARNQTGVTITNGSVVKISGAIGNRPSISLAQARDQVQTFNADNDIIGMATHDIETGTDGFVTTFGLVNGVNTAGFTAGDLLWVSSSAGQYTNIAPSAPIDKTFVGVVTRANVNNGTIFVTPNQPVHFHDLSSVSSSAYTQGDVWMFNQSGSSGVWTNTKTLSGSYSISGSVTATRFTGSLFGTSSWANNVATSSYVNTLNQDVLVTGSMTIGSSSLGASENTLTLGARDIGGEGGQLGFNASGGTYTSASMLDNYQNRFRLLRGTNAGSDAEVAWWSMHTKQMALPAYNSATAFSGTPVAVLGVDSGGNVLTTGYYNYKNTTLSANLTGSVTETQLLQLAIPANTFSTSEIIQIHPVFIKSGTAGAVTIRLKFSTSATMPTGTTGTIASYSFGAAQAYVQMSRKMVVNGGNIYGYAFTTSAIDDVATITTAISSTTFDVTQQQYFYISATLASASDLFNLRSIHISTQ